LTKVIASYRTFFILVYFSFITLIINSSIIGQSIPSEE